MILDMLRDRVVDTFRDRLVHVLRPEVAPERAAEPRRRDPDERRRFFAKRTGNRYWWHRNIGDRYLPDVYAVLSDEEWDVLAAWYEETDRVVMIGECAVPMIGWLTSFLSSNDTARVVQLGTYSGYSTLLAGWALRRAGKRRALFAVDIDPPSLEFAREWIGRAGLSEQVTTHLGDSADRALPARAAEYLGGAPQVVFIDSSHQYEHTLRELDLWYEALQPGGVMVMHDTSAYAATFDATESGGVARAFAEWRERSDAKCLDLSFSPALCEAQKATYLDHCGIGLVIKAA